VSLQRVRPPALFTGLCALLVLAVVSGIELGSVWSLDPVILWELRLPRVLNGCIVGAGLASAGAVYQGLFRNPLADPYLLGASGGAALGAVLVTILGLEPLAPWLFALSIGLSFGSMLLVYKVAQVNGRAPVETLVLSGVVFATFATALLMVLQIAFPFTTYEVTVALMGSLTPAPLGVFVPAAAICLGGIAVSTYYARDLNAIACGEEFASNLGLAVERLKRLLFFAASLLVGAAVTLGGLIGFLGLVVPHLVRLFSGPDHRVVIPASSIAGAAILVFSDAFARTVFAPKDIPVGVVTALCGAPFFVFLLQRRKRPLLGL